jgi:hypothetical protein
MKTALLRCVLLSVIWLFTPRGECVSIASDPFDYPVGSINGRNGGSGFSQPYSGNGQVNAGSLLYTDLPTTGNHVSTTTNGNGMFRLFSTVGRPIGMLDGSGKFGADGSSVYISFLERLDSGVVTAFGDYGGISFFNGATENLFFGDLGFDGFHKFWGVDPQEGSAAVKESGVLVDSTIRLLIGRIDFASGSETIRFYVDPPLGAEPSTPAIGPFLMHDFRFDRIRIQSGGNGLYSFDEVSIGTTYANVVPEPTAYGLLGVSSLLCFATWRGTRRRHDSAQSPIKLTGARMLQ